MPGEDPAGMGQCSADSTTLAQEGRCNSLAAFARNRPITGGTANQPTFAVAMVLQWLRKNDYHDDCVFLGLQSNDSKRSCVIVEAYSGFTPGRYAALQLDFTEAVRTSTEQKELILKLEQDLSTVQAMSRLPRPDAEGADFGHLERIPEPIKEATALFPGVTVAPQPELPQGQMDSLLSIISSQRERFRSRNLELEAESRSMQQTMQALQTELDSLRADNIKLFEKIKFLQGYPGRAGGSDDTVMRYSSQYEERLDPFASFSKRERQRRYLSLSPWDKATLSMGRVILSNKMARTVAFFYTIFLHCLVFLVLYKTAWSESIGRDCTAYCAKKYSDHLHRFHENGENGDMWK